MLKGRFDESSGRPLIVATVVFPRLSIAREVTFLVDTGADNCLIMPTDAANLDINYDNLSGRIASLGLGGVIETFYEPSLLVFKAEKSRYIYRVAMAIHPPSAEIANLPSLLGREILDRW